MTREVKLACGVTATIGPIGWLGRELLADRVTDFVRELAELATEPLRARLEEATPAEMAEWRAYERAIAVACTRSPRLSETWPAAPGYTYLDDLPAEDFEALSRACIALQGEWSALLRPTSTEAYSEASVK